MNDSKRPFIVFSNKLAGYLIMNKCKLLRVRPDVNYPATDVYIFENTEDLHNAIDDYKNMQSERN